MPKITQVVPQTVDSTESETFIFLDASFVRSFKGTKLPFLQKLREKNPEALLEMVMTCPRLLLPTLTLNSMLYTMLSLRVLSIV